MTGSLHSAGDSEACRPGQFYTYVFVYMSCTKQNTGCIQRSGKSVQ